MKGSCGTAENSQFILCNLQKIEKIELYILFCFVYIQKNQNCKAFTEKLISFKYDF